MHLLHGASSAHTSTCSALRKLSPPVGLCVSASHQTRLYHSKQAVRRMLPREKTVSAAHRAHTHCFGCRKKALPLPSVVLASPQKTKCARHPSVVMMSVLLCLVLSVILPPLPVLHLQACLSAWVEQLISVKVKKKQNMLSTNRNYNCRTHLIPGIKKKERWMHSSKGTKVANEGIDLRCQRQRFYIEIMIGNLLEGLVE